jgi:hypothetical protein
METTTTTIRRNDRLITTTTRNRTPKNAPAPLDDVAMFERMKGFITAEPAYGTDHTATMYFADGTEKIIASKATANQTFWDNQIEGTRVELVIGSQVKKDGRFAFIDQVKEYTCTRVYTSITENNSTVTHSEWQITRNAEIEITNDPAPELEPAAEAPEAPAPVADIEKIAFTKIATTAEITAWALDFDADGKTRTISGNGTANLTTPTAPEWIDDHKIEGATVAFLQFKKKEGKIIGKGYEYRSCAWQLVLEEYRDLNA